MQQQIGLFLIWLSPHPVRTGFVPGIISIMLEQLLKKNFGRMELPYKFFLMRRVLGKNFGFDRD